MIARAHVVFHGLVQGVNFRSHCREKAEELGLVGFVRNLRDGTVEAVFEGDRAVVETCIEWNATHQPNAAVDRAEVTWETPTGEFAAFEVRR